MEEKEDISGACRVYSLVANIKNNPNLGEKIRDLKWLKKAVWQQERGEGGYEHWQCFLHFSNSVRGKSIVKSLGITGTYKFLTVVGKNGDSRGLAMIKMENYCRKSDSRISGPWEWNSDKKVVFKFKMRGFENVENKKMKEYLRGKYVEIMNRQYYLDNGCLPDVTEIIG